LSQAENEKESGFRGDPLLRIKHIGYKVRDLALANFNPNYAAFDVHLPRVLARTGLLAYGWKTHLGEDAEFGTDASNEYNYLFLHGLLLHMSALCAGRLSPVDLDRVFWHFGRSVCRAIMECEVCPIRNDCLTGKQRAAND
jgi:endonuclease III